MLELTKAHRQALALHEAGHLLAIHETFYYRIAKPLGAAIRPTGGVVYFKHEQLTEKPSTLLDRAKRVYAYTSDSPEARMWCTMEVSVAVAGAAGVRALGSPLWFGQVGGNDLVDALGAVQTVYGCSQSTAHFHVQFLLAVLTDRWRAEPETLKRLSDSLASQETLLWDDAVKIIEATKKSGGSLPIPA